MATRAPNCSQRDTTALWYLFQSKVYLHGEGGKSRSAGETDKVRKVVPVTDIVDASPVNWEPVEKVQPSPYIDYKSIIMNERTPDLFPSSFGMLNFTGAIYVYSAGGVSLPVSRRVFLDASNPAKLVMRVPQTEEDEDRVVSYYSWSRTNFVYQNNGYNRRKFIFQLFTPANLGTHGATVTDGVPIFTALPEGTKGMNKFSYFQINRGQNQDHITIQKEPLGLYVDTSDGWKVKATDKTYEWDKFKITSFAPPEPSTGSATRKSYKCVPQE